MNIKESPKKILLLGGSSYIGRHLFSKLGTENALATFNRNPLKHGIHFDALSMDLTDVLDAPKQFSHALILLGETNPDFCIRNLQRSTDLNVNCIRNIIDRLRLLEIVPVFISTEAVFDGQKGDYVETDPASPVLTYASQKVQIERYLQQSDRDFLIIRLGRVFGSCSSDGTLPTKWLGQIERDENIRCARDQYFTPVHVSEVVEGLIRLIQLYRQGIYHLCGPDPTSRTDMLRSLIYHYQTYRTYLGKVIECRLTDFPVLEERPANVTMKSDKFVQSTGMELKGIDAWCQIITEKWIEADARNLAV